MQKVQATKKVRTPIWLESDQYHALAYLARETGDPNRTGYVRRYIESEIRDRLGPDWREKIESPDMAVAS